MAKSFDKLVRRTTTAKVRARAVARTRELLGELLLAELRRRSGKSQREVAKALGIQQPSLCKLEKQTDMQVSTLRKIVGALGGRLEVIAKFPKEAVRIKPFGESSRHSRRKHGALELQIG